MTWFEQILGWIILAMFLMLGGCYQPAADAPNWRAGKHYQWIEPGDDVPWPGYLCTEELLEWALSEPVSQP